MLKRDSKARFFCREAGFFFKYRFWCFCSGRKSTLRWEKGAGPNDTSPQQGEWDDQKHQALLSFQQHTPVVVMTDDSSRKRWWMFRGDFYTEDEGYSGAEVKILILDRMQQKERRLTRALARLSQSGAESSAARQSIPDDVKILVWQRDGGRCVKCQGQEKLEFDHIIPLSRGGGNTQRNLQLLCENCNRSKGGNIV